MPPLVSVILPTYNRAALLPRAVQSVLTQQVDDIELIIIDDGSTDETPAVIQTIDDSRIQYNRFVQNRGIGFGRREGIRRARGELIAFIDSDDIWLPGKLAWQVQVMQAYPQIELLFGNYRNINHTNGTQDLGLRQTAPGLERLTVQGLDNDLWEVRAGMPKGLLISNFIATSTVVFRADIVTSIGSFNDSLSGPEDFEFWWRAAVKGIRFGYARRALIERHKDEASITAQTLKFVPRFLNALDACESTARREGRIDLIEPINLARHRAWRSLIRAYALKGRKLDAWQAFRNSMRYGTSPEALLFFGAALAGPKMITMVKGTRPIE